MFDLDETPENDPVAETTERPSTASFLKVYLEAIRNDLDLLSQYQVAEDQFKKLDEMLIAKGH